MRILTRLRSLFHRLAERFRRHRPATAPVITLCNTGRPVGGGGGGGGGRPPPPAPHARSNGGC